MKKLNFDAIMALCFKIAIYFVPVIIFCLISGFIMATFTTTLAEAPPSQFKVNPTDVINTMKLATLAFWNLAFIGFIIELSLLAIGGGICVYQIVRIKRQPKRSLKQTY
jgi:hypothetical protein